MKSQSRVCFLTLLLILISLGVYCLSDAPLDSPASAEDPKPAAQEIQPVDDDMHHFMEYIFEPNYKRLKAAMGSKPADKQTWAAIKEGSLTLSECANLLMTRAPEDGYVWKNMSSGVRGYGSKLYQAARKSNYAEAKKAYIGMLQQCNACHKKFADGKHQLTP